MPAFVISQITAFNYPVTIPRLDAVGAMSEHTVMFRFRKLDADELMDFEQRDMDVGKFAKAFEQAQGDRNLAFLLMAAEDEGGRLKRRSADRAEELMEIVAGWEDVADAAGPMDFNAANLERLLRAEPPAYQAIKQAFREANTGGGRQKNSET